MKNDLKEKALLLRKEKQLSIRQIKEITGLSVGTLSRLLKDYPLSKERVKELGIHTQLIGAHAMRDIAEARRKQFRLDGLILSNKHTQFRELCFLYWGEGTKYTGNKSFSICNTDPDMIKYILSVLEEIGYIDKVKLTCYCYEHSDDESIIKYWKNLLNKDVTIYKVKNSSASKLLKTDKQPNGTMRVDVYSIELLCNILGGIENIKFGRLV